MTGRSDLEGRLPIVYNGKSAEEWYTLYCQETLRNRLVEKVATVVIEAAENETLRGYTVPFREQIIVLRKVLDLNR